MNIRETFSYFNMARADGAGANGALAVSNTGKDINRQGYDSLTFNVHLIATSTAAVPTTSYWYVRIQHTDASALGLGPSDYADVTALDLIVPASATLVSGAAYPINASTYSGAVMKIGYRGTKQYVRANISTIGAFTATSGVAIIEAQLGHAENWPVTVPNLDA